MAVATLENVAKLYVATFNRAPLQTGLEYWVNSGLSIEGIAQSFFDQAETQVLYPAGTTNTAFVTAIYTNLFSRAPLQAGIDYWTGASGLGGTMTRGQMILAMANGALGADATLVANKTAVGMYYAAAGLTAINYSLSSVTAETATMTAAMNAIGDTVTPTYTMVAAATSVTEGSAVSFTVTSNVSQSATRTMNYQISGVEVAGGTATPASDLGAVVGTVTILAGATTGTFTLTPTSDSVVEGFEGFKVSLLNSAFATVATSGNVVIMDGVLSGQNFALTAGGDTFDPNSATAAYKTSAGDDTFRASSDGFLTSSDYIDAGLGTDTLTASVTAADQTLAPVLKSVENVTLTITAADTMTTTFNAVDTTGITTLTIKDAGAASMGGSDEKITVSNLVKTATLGIIGGTASTGATASEIAVTFASALAADTQKVAISTLGKTAVLTLATAETVEITATGTGTTGANTIGSLAATAVKTLNILGAGDLTIGASDLAAAPTINASTATGVIAFTGETAATTTTFIGGTGATTVTTATTGIVAITTGTGNDVVDVSGGNSTGTINVGTGNNEVKVGAQANVTAADIISAGSGAADIITVTDATINATTKTALALGITGFEQVKTTNVAEVTIDFNALSTWNTVIVSAASTATAAAAAVTTAGTLIAGTAAVTATYENTDALIVSAGRTGMVGQAGLTHSNVTVGGAGGNGITLTSKLDNGANAASLTLKGDADITGGVGGAVVDTGDTAGAGGVGLSASDTETLSLHIIATNTSTTTPDDVVIAGGAAGAPGSGTAAAAGSSVVIGDNGTINITDALDSATVTLYSTLNLGSVVGNNANINASTLRGALTVTAADGNTSITGGTKADTLTGGTGINTINAGLGNDKITGGTGGDVLSGGGGRDGFVLVAGDSQAAGIDKISDFGKATIITTLAQVNAMTTMANFQSSTIGLGGADADLLQLGTTGTLAAAATGTNVAAAITTNPATTADISAKGLITVAGAGATLCDTLAEWTAVAAIMTANGNVAAFQFNGNTYAYQEHAGTPDLIELTGVTGVTGITLVGAGGAAAGAVGDIFVL